jgi:hypothetical protein
LYHFIPVAAPLGALAAIGLVWPLEALFDRLAGRRWFAVFSIPAVGLWMASEAPWPDRFSDLGLVVSGQRTWRQQWERYGGRDMRVRDCYALADFLRAHSEPDDRVFLWAYDPLVYFLADRPMSSRFLYHYPMVVEWQPPELRVELIDSLRRDPPRYIAVGSEDAVKVVTGHRKDSWRTFREFRELRAFVNEEYVSVGKIERYHVYERRREP